MGLNTYYVEYYEWETGEHRETTVAAKNKHEAREKAWKMASAKDARVVSVSRVYHGKK